MPGDPASIADLGSWCRRLSDLLSSTASQLGGVCVDQFWQSGAGEEFATLLASVAARCKQTAFRFGQASTVYGTSTAERYAGTLFNLQAEAGKALNSAQSAQSEVMASLSQRNLGPDSPSSVVRDFVNGLPIQGVLLPNLAAAAGELRSAKITVDRLAGEHAMAAKNAAQQLTLITQADGLADDGPPLLNGETPQARFDALNDAAALHDALQGKPPLDAVHQAAVNRVLSDVAAHQNDPGFLADFFGATGGELSTLPMALTSDPTHPDAGAVALIGKLGSLLAAATTAGQLTPGSFAQLSSAEDPYSAALLMKYGPGGRAYGQGQGAAFLAALTQNAEHEVQGSTFNGMTYSDFDAITPILQRCAENGAAARMALGDGSAAAAELAHDLLVTSSSVEVSGEFGPLGTTSEQNQYSPSGGVAEAYLLLAAGIPNPADGLTDFHGKDAYGLTAALNVLSVAADLPKTDPGVVLTGPAQQAMSQYMATYLDDIAKSSQSPGRGLTGFPPTAINLAAGDVPSLLNTVFGDTDQLRLYKAGVGNEMVKALAAMGGRISAPPAHIENLVSLYGIINSIENGRITDAAAQQDADSADRLMMVNLITGVYGNASFESVWHSGAQPITGGLSAIAPQWFDTGHVQAALAQVHAANLTQARTVQVMVVQALYDSGTLNDAQKQSMSSIVVDGNVQNSDAFNQWYDKNEDSMKLGGQSLSELETNMLVRFGWQQ